MYWDPPMQQRTRATLTWPNAVHHGDEGCAVPPAGTKVSHLFWSLINNVCPKNIFKLKKYFVIIFPPLLTSTPSWRETWAWTHCSSAFLAPSFHFSCALRTLPSRTEQYRFNSANIFQEEQIFSHLSGSLRLRPGCWRIRGARRWGWWTSGPASPGLGCSPQSGETWVYKKLSFGVKIY